MNPPVEDGKSLVSVVLLNWNGRKFLAGCLESVFSQDYPEVEVIVVDNASTDGSAGWLAEAYAGRLTLIANEVNTGFSRGMNTGLRSAKGSYLMPLNFDILLRPDFITQMVKALEEDPRRGSISGKLLRFNEDGMTDVIDSTGHVIHKNRYVINRGEDQTDHGQFDRADLVFGTSGAVPMYRREMLEDIAWNNEYFDESFYIMLEDVDLDWRAQLRGWQCAYAPAAVAYHWRTASGVGKSRLIQRHYYKNRYLAIWKNDFWLSWLKHLPQILLMDLYLNLDILFTSPIGLLQAWGDLIRLTPRTLRRRRAIASRRKVTRSYMEQWFKPYKWRHDIKRKLGI